MLPTISSGRPLMPQTARDVSRCNDPQELKDKLDQETTSVKLARDMQVENARNARERGDEEACVEVMPSAQILRLTDGPDYPATYTTKGDRCLAPMYLNFKGHLCRWPVATGVRKI